MKLIGPLFSESASGTIADVLTFSDRRTGPQVRYQRKQKDAGSSEQLAQRVKFNASTLACRFFECGVVWLMLVF